MRGFCKLTGSLLLVSVSMGEGAIVVRDLLAGFSFVIEERVAMAIVGKFRRVTLGLMMAKSRLTRNNEHALIVAADVRPLTYLPILGVPWHPRGMRLLSVVLLVGSVNLNVFV
jgi:hypothetical protein